MSSSAADRRTLVTGVSGQLGAAFLRLLPDAIALTRDDLDLENPDGVEERIREADPDVIINCAAWTAVDAAEADEDRATLVNGHAVGRLASVAAGLGAAFVSFSTDYVFPGDASEPYLEDDATDPINAYGRSKLVGERLALDAYPSALIVRTSWLQSGTHPNFVATMLRLAERGEPFRVVNDQIGSPTVVDDVAGCTLKLLEAGGSGIVHVTNAGETTWFGLARHAIAEANLDPELAEPCATAEYPTPARRPKYSVLGSAVRSDIAELALRDWKDAVSMIVGQQRRGRNHLSR